MKKIILVATVIIVVAVLGIWWSARQIDIKIKIQTPLPDTTVEVLPQTKVRGDWLYTTRQLGLGNQKITALLADTPEKQERGLGLYDALRSDEGMLFVFANSGIYSFWMKDMTFAIDILWLDENGKIVYVKEHASPEKPTEIFTNQVPAKYVLELLSGEVKKNNLQVGAQIEL